MKMWRKVRFYAQAGKTDYRKPGSKTVTVIGTLGVRMDNHLNMNHMCAAAAKQVNTILDCINGGIESKSREVLVPFYKALVSSTHPSYYPSLPTYDYYRVVCIFTIYIVLFVP
uniref:Uncharacterized protein n=1 Tax=Micrurus corallinus TaxID=54390 RepID=A0A2D4EKX1_MICCO